MLSIFLPQKIFLRFPHYSGHILSNQKRSFEKPFSKKKLNKFHNLFESKNRTVFQLFNRPRDPFQILNQIRLSCHTILIPKSEIFIGRNSRFSCTILLNRNHNLPFFIYFMHFTQNVALIIVIDFYYFYNIFIFCYFAVVLGAEKIVIFDLCMQKGSREW